jgi:ribosomal protein L37AE/L43A
VSKHWYWSSDSGAWFRSDSFQPSYLHTPHETDKKTYTCSQCGEADWIWEIENKKWLCINCNKDTVPPNFFTFFKSKGKSMGEVNNIKSFLEKNVTTKDLILGGIVAVVLYKNLNKIKSALDGTQLKGFLSDCVNDIVKKVVTNETKA